MVPLSKADIAALNDEETSSTADSKAAAISERIIVGNSTQDQAFQINGAAGEDIWQDISRIEIRNNIATGSSFQINHATTFEVLKYTMERQDRILAEERKEKREAQERREERVRLEKERRKKREVQDRKEKEKLMLTG
jgi:hypothetical protein